ncbi:MAG TPA: hypothetical protein VJO35_06145 [Terriglobales bacterium]|nr:hypothetical protein [Terriglobales bacterium]
MKGLATVFSQMARHLSLQKFARAQIQTWAGSSGVLTGRQYNGAASAP